MNSGQKGYGDELLAVCNLVVHARIQGEKRVLVSGVDLEVRTGEFVGIVGESGSGKSLTARAITGALPEGLSASGGVVFGGENILQLNNRSLRRLQGSGFALAFQDPFTALNPLRRCGDQIIDGMRRGAADRKSRRELRDEAVRRLAEVGISDPRVADSYPFQLSGGMRQRVGLAAALADDPKLLVADEPATALDVTTQKEILRLLRSIQRRRDMAVILITHDLRLAFAVCHRVYVFYAGAIVEEGSAPALEREPLHPYTLGLLLSEPRIDRRVAELESIPGAVPAAGSVLTSCGFAERCQWSANECVTRRPQLTEIGEGRKSRCVRLPSVRNMMFEERARLEDSSEPLHIPLRGRADSIPLVSTEHLTKFFGTAGSKRARTAVNDVSVSIWPGESVALVGESGSGKTTIARMLVGLEQPSSGIISVAGVRYHDLSRAPSADRKAVRKAIQIVFQDPYSTLNPVRTVGSTLREVLTLAGNDSRGSVTELLAQVGLPKHFATRKPVALSGGERQRVAIARALALRPQLLVCDEPVSALDVSVQAQIINLFRELRAELSMSLLFITHDLAVVRQIADRVYVLQNGSVVEEGLVERVLDHPSHPYSLELLESVPRADPGWLDDPQPVGRS